MSRRGIAGRLLPPLIVAIAAALLLPVAAPAERGQPAPPRAPGEWALIRAGTFTMGPQVSQPNQNTGARRVTLTRDLWLQATEVTQGQWLEVMGANPSLHQQCGPSCPVDNVSWFDAVDYVNRLSALEGLPACYRLDQCHPTAEGDRACDAVAFWGTSCPGYRLPTEAEWEYAARAGAAGPALGELADLAWFTGNSGNQTHPVKGRRPNAFGLYDMLGNVYEWCQDWHEASLSAGAVIDPVGPQSGGYRLLRGGCYANDAGDTSPSARLVGWPAVRNGFQGFRPARTIL